MDQGDNASENQQNELEHPWLVDPHNRWYVIFEFVVLASAVYSLLVTPLEFGFFRGLHGILLVLDIIVHGLTFVDIMIKFIVPYPDYFDQMVYDHRLIALRYIKSYFLLDLVSCVPWGIIYKAFRRRKGAEVVRCLIWTRLIRVHRLFEFSQRMENKIVKHYIISRIVKLILCQLYSTHIAGCIFYYLANVIRGDETWIDNLATNNKKFLHFREMHLWTQYVTSVYFCVVTSSTVGFGDIHPVNRREITLTSIYITFNVIFGVYFTGCISALVVKTSKKLIYMTSMDDLHKFTKIYRLGRQPYLRIKQHLRLEYERGYSNTDLLKDIPVSVRAEICRRLYRPCLDNNSIFNDCSEDFKNQIVTRVHEELFYPGEVIIERENFMDQDSAIEVDGPTLALNPNSSFGEISVLCNIPQPSTVSVREECRLMRIDKQSFCSILETNVPDRLKVLTKLLEGNTSNGLAEHLTYQINRLQVDIAESLKAAVLQGDVYLLKTIITYGGDVSRKDQKGRTALHLAASGGHKDITEFLLEVHAMDINAADKLGNTPLSEANKNGHREIAALLVSRGALAIDDGLIQQPQVQPVLATKMCRVFACNPFADRKECGRGYRIRVPTSMDDLISNATAKLNMPDAQFVVLNEYGCVVPEVDMIRDGDRLYLRSL
ncbi:potassium channel SKOR-like isoform X2 [Salvia splendens]|uniref:potassium channel SKOR-like isoform X2 n=1 Tax=Salvia splendens TaxID=180675 RepID=UPI001C255E5B|nr:potassium channel SKOR-like isoform X2 [Salvia splendens]